MTYKKPKKPPETDPDQSERFRKAVRDLEAAGVLNPTDGDAALDALLSRQRPNDDSETRYQNPPEEAER